MKKLIMILCFIGCNESIDYPTIKDMNLPTLNHDLSIPSVLDLANFKPDLNRMICSNNHKITSCTGINGSPCNDNDACTYSDTCNSNICEGFRNFVCISCQSDNDCSCKGLNTVFCDGQGDAQPTGKCLANKTCELTRRYFCESGTCLNGIGCY